MSRHPWIFPLFGAAVSGSGRVVVFSSQHTFASLHEARVTALQDCTEHIKANFPNGSDDDAQLAQNKVVLSAISV